MRPPTTSEQETNIQREQQQGQPRLYPPAREERLRTDYDGERLTQRRRWTAGQSEYAQQGATTQRLRVITTDYEEDTADYGENTSVTPCDRLVISGSGTVSLLRYRTLGRRPVPSV
jgi:hypothetical protein